MYQESLTIQNSEKNVYHLIDDNGKLIHKCREMYKNENRIILYPYSINYQTGQIVIKKIKQLEFIGWKNLESIPDYFRKKNGYGFSKLCIKQFMSILYTKFKHVKKITIAVNGITRFSKYSLNFNWSDLDIILKETNKDKFYYDKNRKILITNLIASKTSKIKGIPKKLYSGELEAFLKRFDSFDKISAKDIESVSTFIQELPPSKITSTQNFIHAKENINVIYLDDLIDKFETLLNDKKDIEEKWQKFFNEYSWIMNHLFPYQVILKKDKAYLGGKTYENDEGRIVDYLFECGFKDNFALIEIKTHKKELLKKSPYRSPSVFSISDELSGGVNQCLDQKDIFLREIGSTLNSFDPKCILLIGQKEILNSNQKML